MTSTAKELSENEMARRVGYILCREAERLFGRPFEDKLEDFLERLLAAGAAVEPTAYKVAYTLRAGLEQLKVSQK